ncbi:MAG: GUN4 domain-containing protein [Microcoleaceae cyanobacterium]|jgi:serine/threonine protein kinase
MLPSPPFVGSFKKNDHFTYTILENWEEKIMVWTTGKQLYGNRYTIERILGEGSLEITYLARNKEGQPVVIKTLVQHLVNHPQFSLYRDTFRDEALQFSLCKHPNLVKIEDYFTLGDFPCIVMEYVQGEDLWSASIRKGIFSESQALSFIRQIGEALIVIHSKGLLHRDIKPQNMLLKKIVLSPGYLPIKNINNTFSSRLTEIEKKEQVVLIDVGLGRGSFWHENQSLSSINLQGFTAPEMSRDFGTIGEYTDVYSLAASLYYLVTKTLPISPNFRLLNQPLSPPKMINYNLSDMTNLAIIKGMELEFNHRPKSVKEWLEMLPIDSINSEEKTATTSIWGSQKTITNTVANNTAQTSSFVTSSRDYKILENLLANSKWREADQETAKKMLEIADKIDEGWLEVEDIDRVPAEDLRTLDQLWVKYSQGHFGFSVQKRIYKSLGETRNYDRKIWEGLGNEVGWRINNRWLSYNELNFGFNGARGHLPAWGWHGVAFGWVRLCLLSRREF